MGVLDITEEQKATLHRGTSRGLKETRETRFDSVTGEVLDEIKTETKITGTEPDYIKVYYRTMLAFGGIQDVPVDFLLALSGCITWATDNDPMIFQSTKVMRERICSQCGIKEDMYRKYLQRCKKHGLLVAKPGYRAVYDVNPFFIARGRWADISKLRGTFNFTDGTWSRDIEEVENT